MRFLSLIFIMFGLSSCSHKKNNETPAPQEAQNATDNSTTDIAAKPFAEVKSISGDSFLRNCDIDAKKLTNRELSLTIDFTDFTGATNSQKYTMQISDVLCMGQKALIIAKKTSGVIGFNVLSNVIETSGNTELSLNTLAACEQAIFPAVIKSAETQKVAMTMDLYNRISANVNKEFCPKMYEALLSSLYTELSKI